MQNLVTRFCTWYKRWRSFQRSCYRNRILSPILKSQDLVLPLGAAFFFGLISLFQRHVNCDGVDMRKEK